MDTNSVTNLMNVVAAEVQRSIKAGHGAGITREAAAVAAMIGVISYLRVEGIREEPIISDARKVVPVANPDDGIIFRRES